MTATGAIIIGGLCGAILARTLVALCRLALMLTARLAQPSAAMLLGDTARYREAERLGGGADAQAVHVVGSTLVGATLPSGNGNSLSPAFERIENHG